MSNTAEHDVVDIYLIGGASRSGKTLLASQLQEQLGVSVFSLDLLSKPLRIVRGGPSEPTQEQNEVAEQAKDFIIEARRDWPIYQALIDNTALHGRDYCFESESLLPESLAGIEAYLDEQLQWRREQHEVAESMVGAIAVHSVVLGYPSLTQEQKLEAIRDYSQLEKVNYDWTRSSEDAELEAMAAKRIDYSRWLRDECEVHGINFVDTGVDFEQSIDQALAHLVSGG